MFENIDRKVNQFLDRMLEADHPILLDTYESKIRDLQEEKIYLSEKVQICSRPMDSFTDTFRTAVMSQPFLALENFKHGNYEMVGPVGLEPTTNPL